MRFLPKAVEGDSDEHAVGKALVNFSLAF
jgi:hypothetical protein